MTHVGHSELAPTSTTPSTLDACHYSAVDEPQTELIFWLHPLTNSVGNRSHT